MDPTSHSANKKGKRVPQIPRFQSIANTMRFVKNPIPVIYETMEIYGDTYGFHLGGIVPGIITCDPVFIQHFLQKNHRNYIKSELQTKDLKFYVGSGLLTSDGPYWLQQRRLIQPGFHRKKLAGLTETMQLEVSQFCDRLEKTISEKEELDIAPLMMEIAFRVVAKSLFGTNLEDDKIKTLSHCISTVQEFFIKEIRQPYLKWWYQISGQITQHKNLVEDAKQLILEGIVERQQSNENHDDLLDMLLDVRYEDTGEGMTEKQLLDESLILFVAGHETSANALAWTLYLLSQHPEVAEKLRIERNTFVKNNNPSFTELAQMKYTLQVVQESMRLYPPAWITERVALEDDEVNGWFIPKGAAVIAFIHGVHHAPNLWEDPEKFQPDRFNETNRKNKVPFDFMPFGGGPRLCIGNNFALMEMQLIVSEIIHRFDIELVENQVIEPLPLVTLRPKNGIKMKFKKRG